MELKICHMYPDVLNLYGDGLLTGLYHLFKSVHFQKAPFLSLNAAGGIALCQ